MERNIEESRGIWTGYFKRFNDLDTTREYWFWVEGLSVGQFILTNILQEKVTKDPRDYEVFVSFDEFFHKLKDSFEKDIFGNMLSGFTNWIKDRNVPRSLGDCTKYFICGVQYFLYVNKLDNDLIRNSEKIKSVAEQSFYLALDHFNQMLTVKPEEEEK